MSSSMKEWARHRERHRTFGLFEPGIKSRMARSSDSLGPSVACLSGGLARSLKAAQHCFMSDDVVVPRLPTKKPIRLIAESGRCVTGAQTAGFALPAGDTLLGLYRKMVVARRFDAQVTALTRQGRLATYPSALGQEACEIAAVAALEKRDWLFPTYRDTIALLTRGV